jgi:hypothetical protein
VIGNAPIASLYRYVYASYIDEPVVRKGTGTGGTIHYYHRNQQYSVYAVTTSAGAVTERYAYSAYGQPTILDISGSQIVSSTISNRYCYNGREWDPIVGLNQITAKWMSGVVGRFVVRDMSGLSSQSGNGVVQRYAAIAALQNKPWVCTVTLRCINIVRPFATHCGVEVTFPGPPIKTDYYHIMDNSGNSVPKDCDYSGGGQIDPPFGGNWWVQAVWALTDQHSCDCFAKQAALLNTARLPYSIFPGNGCNAPDCNSNYAAKCMLGYCGLKYKWNWWFPPVGWKHRPKNCLKKDWVVSNENCDKRLMLAFAETRRKITFFLLIHGDDEAGFEGHIMNEQLSPYDPPASDQSPLCSYRRSLATRLFLASARNWIFGPLVGGLVYFAIIHIAIVVSHSINPRIRFLGYEYVVVPVLGIVGGLAVPCAFNIAHLLTRKSHMSPILRWIGASIAGFSVGFNFYCIGTVLMLPILTIWSSIDGTVPSFSNSGDRERWNLWGNIGTTVISIAGCTLGFCVQLMDANRENSKGSGKLNGVRHL